MRLRQLLIKKNITFMLYLTLGPAIGLAGNADNPNLFIFHINGINTTRNEALVNLRMLHDTAKIRSNVITWNVLYNATHGKISRDLFDVFIQKKEENKELTIDDYVILFMKVYDLSYPVGSKEFELIKDIIKDKYLQDMGFVGYNLENIFNDYEQITNLTNSMVELIKCHENSDKNIVLLIPHSQGTLYANSLRNYLVDTRNISKNNIGIYAIANPADKIESTVYPETNYYVGDPPDEGVQYITADNDFVINSLRVFSNFSPVTNQPMSANIHLTECQDHKLCHSLTNAYLLDKHVALAISKKINLFIMSLAHRFHDPNKIMISYHDYDQPVSLISNTGETLCNAGKCDVDIFGNILFESDFFNSQIVGGKEINYNFSFPGKLKPGTYLIVIDEFNYNFRSPFVGSDALEDAYGYSLSDTCGSPYENLDIRYKNPGILLKCEAYKLSMQQTPGIAYFERVIGHNPSHKASCSKIPEICYNNQYILGKFTLNDKIISNNI